MSQLQAHFSRGSLTKDQFCITDPDKFEPSARWASQNTLGETRGIVSKQAPTKRELLAGIYKPRLMLYQYNYLSNKRETTLKIELSLPKLLFGNNFDELRNKDFLPVAQKLAEMLETMGNRGKHQESYSSARICYSLFKEYCVYCKSRGLEVNRSIVFMRVDNWEVF